MLTRGAKKNIEKIGRVFSPEEANIYTTPTFKPTKFFIATQGHMYLISEFIKPTSIEGEKKYIVVLLGGDWTSAEQNLNAYRMLRRYDVTAMTYDDAIALVNKRLK